MIKHKQKNIAAKSNTEINKSPYKLKKPLLNNEEIRNSYITYLNLFFIFLITAACYHSIIKSEFLLLWDDGEQVLNNKDIRNFSLHGIIKMFSTFYVGMYQPVTTLTYALDYALFGLSSKAFHISNLIYHFTVVALLYLFLSKFFKNKALLFFLVLIFAVHPTSVESVAWISARSNILFTIFYISGLLVYFKYSEFHKKKHFFLAFVLFLLSCLSKSAAVTFPLLLLLIDFYFYKIDKRKLIEKIPFFIFSIFFIILTFKARILAEHIADISGRYNSFDSLILILFGFIFNLRLFLFPFNNAAFYTYPEKTNGSLPPEIFIALFLTVILLSVLFIVLWKRKKEALFGLLFFMISISAMLKFVATGLQITADRYLYLPMAGLLITVGYVTEQLFRKFIIASVSISIIIVVLLSYRTITYNTYWTKEEALFSHTIRLQPEAVPCKNFLGTIYRKKGNYGQAMKLFNEIINKYPNYKSTYNNRGNLHKDLKNYDKALADYHKALVLNNNNKKGEAEILTNIGIVYAMTNNFDEALHYFNKAVISNDNFYPAYYNRERVYSILGDKNNAIKDLNKAKLLKPDLKK